MDGNGVRFESVDSIQLGRPRHFLLADHPLPTADVGDRLCRFQLLAQLALTFRLRTHEGGAYIGATPRARSRSNASVTQAFNVAHICLADCLTTRQRFGSPWNSEAIRLFA